MARLPASFQGNRSGPVRDALLEHGPPGQHSLSDLAKKLGEDPAGQVMNTLGSIAMYGSTDSCQRSAIDDYALGSLRGQCQGDKEVMLLPVCEVHAYLKKTSKLPTFTEKDNMLNTLGPIMQRLSDEELVDMDGSAEVAMHKTVVAAGTVLYIPSGYVTVERSLGGQAGYGVRTITLGLPTSTSIDSWCVLHQSALSHKLEVGKTPALQSISRIWELLTRSPLSQCHTIICQALGSSPSNSNMIAAVRSSR